MIRFGRHTLRDATTRALAPSQADASARRALVSSIKQRWTAEGRPDAAAALQAHAELNASKSIALELAYEEYCRRIETGEAVDADAFCDRYSRFRHTLRRLISIHRWIGGPGTARGLPELKPGQSYLDFHILDELGQGAFATVYLAEQAMVGNRLVALKVAADGAEEANVLGKLSHPNIVPIYSVAADPQSGCSMICMPYAGRATLCDLLDVVFATERPRLEAAVIQEVALGAALEPPPGRPATRAAAGSYLEAVLRIGVQLADALAHAHGQGIIHRDLKPSNVLLAFDGRPMILDFNLSSDRDRELQRIGGTLPYMPPEQAAAIAAGSADAGVVDARSDVFALGAILYELLSGHAPFEPGAERLTTANLAAHVAARRAMSLQQVREAAVVGDESVLRIVARCLSCEPAERPQSAAELRQLLADQLSPARRLSRWVSAHRRSAALGAALLLAATAAAGYAAARREPYPVRELKVALAEIDARHFGVAGERLNALVRADKNFFEARLARARLYARTGEMALAYDDYHAVHQARPTALTAACQGYCMAMLGHHTSAIASYQEAIRRGLASPAVLSNLGWSLLKMNRRAEARAELTRAIEQDATFQPAFHNRGLVGVAESFAADDVQPEALADLERARDLGPASGDLYHALANLYAIQTRKGADAGDLALTNLQLAIDHGLDPARLAQEPMFARIADKIDLRPLAGQPRRNPQQLIGVHIVNPDLH